MTTPEPDPLRTLPCPGCGAVGTLTFGTRFRAHPLGTWSLAGHQLKTTASEVPVLECPCGFVKHPSGPELHEDAG